MTRAREQVEATPRRAMSPQRRLRIYMDNEGRCYKCRVKVPLKGTVIEHPTQLWMGGSDDDKALKLICPPCDKVKTAKDASERAHVKRLIANQDPANKKPSRLQGRKLSHPTLTRGFDGTVRVRSPSSADQTVSRDPGCNRND